MSGEENRPSDESQAPTGLSRRAVLCGVAGGGCALALLQLTGCTVAEVYCEDDDAANFDFDLTDERFSALSDVGGMVAVDNGCLKLVLIRRNDETVIALDRICPHTFCEMSPAASGAWHSSEEELECTCHGSRFGADGALINGPAQSGVDSFPVSFDKEAGAGSVDVESVLANGSAS
jgi:nitrite reductase/ring-hydroxylating ferredoxin subunit